MQTSHSARQGRSSHNEVEFAGGAQSAARPEGDGDLRASGAGPVRTQRKRAGKAVAERRHTAGDEDGYGASTSASVFVPAVVQYRRPQSQPNPIRAPSPGPTAAAESPTDTYGGPQQRASVRRPRPPILQPESLAASETFAPFVDRPLSANPARLQPPSIYSPRTLVGRMHASPEQQFTEERPVNRRRVSFAPPPLPALPLLFKEAALHALVLANENLRRSTRLYLQQIALPSSDHVVRISYIWGQYLSAIRQTQQTYLRDLSAVDISESICGLALMHAACRDFDMQVLRTLSENMETLVHVAPARLRYIPARGRLQHYPGLVTLCDGPVYRGVDGNWEFIPLYFPVTFNLLTEIADQPLREPTAWQLCRDIAADCVTIADLYASQFGNVAVVDPRQPGSELDITALYRREQNMWDGLLQNGPRPKATERSYFFNIFNAARLEGQPMPVMSPTVANLPEPTTPMWFSGRSWPVD